MTGLCERLRLVELAERIEKATGPDRELDREIANGVIGWPMFAIPVNPIWRYTASLDAAMTLVPEGWFLNGVYENGEGRTYATLRKCNLAAAVAATPALALCAAALKARAQAKDSKEQLS